MRLILEMADVSENGPFAAIRSGHVLVSISGTCVWCKRPDDSCVNFCVERISLIDY